MHSIQQSVAAGALLAALSPWALAADTSQPSLSLYPPEVRLDTAAARQRVVVVLTRPDGVTQDVTAQATLAMADTSRARLEGPLVCPVSDGATKLTATHAGLTAAVPVQVSKAQTPRPVSFKLDVMPVFMRAGCNSGGCHGSARGQDGFHLSLFGYDADGDHRALTREIATRRINLAVPEESLLLEKAVGSVQHTGGKRFETNSPYYQAILAWLKAGAPPDPGEVPKAERVDLYPPAMVLEGNGAKQQMIAVARYADGTSRDVTSLALFLTNNDNSAGIDADGLVTAAHPGEAFVMARFSTHTVGSQVIALSAGQQVPAFAQPPVNYVDERIESKLRKLRIAPAPLCSDETFLRRVSLDICGQLPTTEEYAEFAADRSPDKRAKLIDRLLARKEFSEIWAMNFAEILMIRSNIDLSYKSMFLYADWLSRQIAANVPIDELARQMLASNGGTFRNPASNFYEVEKDTLKTAENVAQVFMGIRVQCSQCHNHPFDRWTMDDYYSFAAFFCQVGRKQGEDYRETIVFDRRGGEVRHPVGNRVMPPKYLGGETPEIKDQDRREVLARWITSPENPYFARSMANRIWAFFFGLGIVEPVDDFRVSNPASNPELLDALGKKLVEYRYDFKRLVRDICNSHAYQRAVVRDGSIAAERNFAVARVRRLKAEILLDCISQATDTKDKFKGLPVGSRAVQIADGSTTSYFLTTFGRTPRESVCATDVRTEPTLSQALHLLNGETIEQKIRQGGLIGRWLASGKKADEIITLLYVRCLSRPPTPNELSRLTAQVKENGKPALAMADVFWSLLNSREFIFNH